MKLNALRLFSRRRNSGLYLVELLIVISILSIIGTMATNLFKPLVESAMQNSRFDSLFTSVQTTRLFAIERQRIMTLCASNDAVSCHKSGSQFLLIFDDQNNNKIVDQGELIQNENIASKNTLATITVSGGRNYIRFRPDGTAMDFGRIKLCPLTKDANYADELILNYGGRLRKAPDNDHNGIVEDLNGVDISC